MPAFRLTALLSTAAIACALTGADAAHARTDVRLHIGSDYYGLSARTPGPVSVAGRWSHNADADANAFAVGIGPSFPLGPLTATARGEAVYLDPRFGGSAFGLGASGELSAYLSRDISAYAQLSYAPEALMGGDLGDYVASSAGVRWTLLRPLSFDLGYRYERAHSQGGTPGTTFSQGPFIGLGLAF